ncbi:hypothetical protein H5410_061786 [Solanum commersonii]|uniref:Uncharacterized protein n=1 Tax=Solanum commersonii TaxID=4109 RepID=A0A9J5W9U6_SOLCO|nr:hypothetical protein H5410_061786 [Solanum commersonii]
MGFLGCDRNTVSKQAKNEESTRPKSKFLELKPIESSSSSKPSPNLELGNHSTLLVEITDQLGDPPFGRFHRRLALSFSIVAFWIIGRHSITSRNCSVICPLLLFTANLIISFRAQDTGTKGEDKIFWRLAEWVRRFSDLHFFVLSAAFVPFLPSSVHAFPQTPNI